MNMAKEKRPPVSLRRLSQVQPALLSALRARVLRWVVVVESVLLSSLMGIGMAFAGTHDGTATQLVVVALLLLCSAAAVVLAGVAAAGMTLTPPIAVGALALSAVLVTGAVVLHRALREARWDAGYRLR